MVTSIGRIEQFLADKDFDAFTSDALVHDAVVRNLEIISEASRHITDELKAQTPEIPWRKVADIGNWLRHAYEGISDRILWDSIQYDLPKLLKTIQGLLSRPDVL